MELFTGQRSAHADAHSTPAIPAQGSGLSAGAIVHTECAASGTVEHRPVNRLSGKRTGGIIETEPAVGAIELQTGARGDRVGAAGTETVGGSGDPLAGRNGQITAIKRVISVVDRDLQVAVAGA